jgi:hypothetical protein
LGAVRESGPTARIWLTTVDRSQLMREQAPVAFHRGSSSLPTIVVTRISVVVLNRLAREELLTTVKLATRCPPETPPRTGVTPAPPLAPQIYKIRQEFKIGIMPGAVLNGEVIPPGEQDFRAPVLGELTDACGSRLISLSFDMSTPLPSNEHVTIVVDLPKKLTVLSNVAVPAPPSGRTVEPRAIDLVIDRPTGTNFAVTLGVSGVRISGSPD